MPWTVCGLEFTIWMSTSSGCLSHTNLSHWRLPLCPGLKYDKQIIDEPHGIAERARCETSIGFPQRVKLPMLPNHLWTQII